MEYLEGARKFVEALQGDRKEFSFTVTKSDGFLSIVDAGNDEIDKSALLMALLETFVTAARNFMREIGIKGECETASATAIITAAIKLMLLTGERRCETCRKYLGGGQCRDNLEKECADGNFEMWEGIHDEPRES